MPGSEFRVGFDVGGTFTDFALQKGDGELATLKTLTTYPDPSDACLEGLDELVRHHELSWEDLAQGVHGTTLGSNLVIERKATGVALLTTAGFRDVLLIGRQKRHQLYDLQIEKPKPLLERSMIREASERVLVDGRVSVPLDEEGCRRTLRSLRDEGVRSLAVCLLHSYVNPVHERRIAELANEETPEILVSLSSDVSPQFREYERTSTTVVNAYLMQAVREYLGRMQTELQSRGYQRKLFIMQSGGGVATAEAMSRYPVRMIESGPSAGALMAMRYGELTGNRDLIAFDMGGTTAKLSLVVDGALQTVDLLELHKVGLAPGSGLPLNIRSLDLVEIGAGGGSIASAGLGTIKVGPESAGSMPGPVCYGLGGSAPTVTDANLVLGYLNPASFAGGSMALDVEAAREALGARVADPLGLSLEEAAWGVHTIVNLNMELATRVVSIERGHDPRDLALVATGGCGPTHACRLAQALGLPIVIMPAAAGVASAIGLLDADPMFDVSRTHFSPLREVDWDHVNRMFEEMEGEASEVIDESTGRAPTALRREADLRYVGQGYELTIPVPAGMVSSESVEILGRSFESAYEKRYRFVGRGEEIEVTTWRLTAEGTSARIQLPRFERSVASESEAIREIRRAYFPEAGGPVDTSIYDRYSLFPGATITGPAVVEERESTTVLPPGMSARMDEFGNLLVEVG